MRDSSIISSVSALLGACVGGAITYWVQRVQRRADRLEERRAIAAAIAAELNAYIDLMILRDHTAHYREIVRQIRAGAVIPAATFKRSNVKLNEMFPAFFSQLSKLGLLGEVAFDLGRFFTLLAGVIATVAQFGSGHLDGVDMATRANLIEKEIDNEVWEQALRTGRDLVPRLKKIAGF